MVFGFSVGGYAALRAVASGAPASAVIVDSSFLSSRDVFMFGATKVVPLAVSFRKGRCGAAFLR